MRINLCALTVLGAILFQPSFTSAEEPLKVMERFVGTWQTEVVDKAEPDVKKIDVEVCEWTLSKKFLIGRQLNDSGATKALWLMKYDPAKENYPHWFFSVDGEVERLTGRWEARSCSLTAQFDSDPNIKSTSYFENKDQVKIELRGVDENGEVFLDVTGKQKRQPAEAGQKMLAKWNEVRDAVELDSETATKTLERLTGTWEVKRSYRESEWFPKEETNTRKVTRSWVLNKRYVFGTSVGSDGRENISLITFQQDDYQSYWFDSSGNTGTGRGLYPVMMGFKMEGEYFPDNLQAGLTPSASITFPDDDHYVWHVTIKDADDKKYFDGEWAGTRVK